MLIRLIASGIVVLGGMELALEFTRDRLARAEASLWHWITGGALLAAGLILFAASRKLAEQLAEQLADDVDE